MQTAEVENFLARGMALMGLHLANRDEVIARLATYFRELKKWNKQINLIGRQQEDRMILENHFLDSLTLLPQVKLEGAPTEVLLDVGTGAGFPGLVIKAACPWLSTVLLEPRQNRYYFLRHMVRTLQLDGVDLLNVRLVKDDQGQEPGNRKFSIITSRAFADIDKFVGLSADLLAPGGKIICMKGPRGVGDLKAFQQSSLAKGFTAEVHKMKLPFSKAERLLIILHYSG